MRSRSANCIDAVICRSAAGQHGLMTLAQLRELGASRSTIRTRVANGQWAPAESGVLRIGGAPVTWESRLLALLLSAGGSAVASHTAAARLWGLRGFEHSEPELTVARTSSFRRSGVVVHRLSDHAAEEAVAREGIPTTPLERTLLDLGAVKPKWAVEAAVDDALVKGLTSWDSLEATLARYRRRGRDGVAALGAVLATAAG